MSSARHRRLVAALALGLGTASCARKTPATLAAVCAGGRGAAHVVATVDFVRGPGGPALASLKGSEFELTLAFARGDPRRADDGSARDCAGTRGSATFSGALPEAIGHAASAQGETSWRVQDDSVLLDLNPRVRDSNVFLTLPLHGGRGHWGLSTFAGEVAGGATRSAP
jgi:hypothetical protein